MTIDTGDLAVLITALGAAAGSIVAAWRTGAIQRETHEQTLTINEINKDAAVIKGHVNSEKTAAEGREKTLQAEVKLLREQLLVQDKTSALLAQAAAVEKQTAARNGMTTKPTMPTDVVKVEVVNEPLQTTVQKP